MILFDPPVCATKASISTATARYSFISAVATLRRKNSERNFPFKNGGSRRQHHSDWTAPFTAGPFFTLSHDPHLRTSVRLPQIRRIMQPCVSFLTHGGIYLGNKSPLAKQQPPWGHIKCRVSQSVANEKLFFSPRSDASKVNHTCFAPEERGGEKNQGCLCAE